MVLDREVLRIARLGSWSDAEARLVVEAWRRSGESRAEFGRRYDIAVHRLYHWIGKFDGRRRTPKSSTPVFHPVEVRALDTEEAPPAIEIRMIRVPLGMAPEELRAVLSALG